MTEANQQMIQKAAGAIANSLGARRGMPPISNVLDLLPVKLRDEVREQAEAALEECGAFALLEACEAFFDLAISNGNRCFFCNAAVYGSNDCEEHSPDCEQEIARAAIAKATGGQQ